MLNKTTLTRKKKTKKSKALLFYFVIIALLSALAYGYRALNSHLQESLSKFELTDIQISGNYILTDKEILRFLGLRTGEKLLAFIA